MFYADTVGLKAVLAKLKEFQAKFGDDFKPASLLEKLAAEGGTFTNS
jgi:3-hydroxyacyl-CoA dehydrogenase